MKNLLIILLVIPIAAFGQKNSLGGSVGIVIPNSTLEASAKLGWGLHLNFQHNFNRYFTGIAELGFCSFGEKTISFNPGQPVTVKIKTSTIPFQVGAKFHITNNDLKKQSIYAFATGGLAELTGKITVNGKDETPPNEFDFGYSVGLGYQIKDIDFSFRQQFVTSSGKTINYFDVRLTWIFMRK